LTGQPPRYVQGLSSLGLEVSLENLSVTGQFPSWLTGTLIRNGPAKFEVGNEGYRHWFDGLAMLHKFSFRNGRVSYANRFLDTGDFRETAEEGRITRREFATDPCRTIVGRVMAMFVSGATDNANVNISVLADRLWPWQRRRSPLRSIQLHSVQPVSSIPKAIPPGNSRRRTLIWISVVDSP
jgi:beta,beta-carotene 9',10'-dioxygenase